MEHSIIACSAAHIWGAPGGCRAYPTMAAMYPDEDTEDARIGDAIHLVGADGIRARNRGHAMPRPEVAPNGVVMTDEYLDAAELYVEYCAALCREHGIFGGPMLRIEERVEAPSVHPLSFGTPDFSLFNRDVGEIHIVDCKGGRLLVEVFENWPLANYYAGLADHYGIDGYIDQDLRVTFTIVQPRGYHPDGPIRSWETTGTELRSMVNQLRHAAAECFEPDPLVRSGPHCRYCPARLHCPVGTTAGLSIYESAMRMATHDMSPLALGLQLLIVDRALDDLKSLHKALAAQVEALSRQGTAVPHWITEPAFGRLAWSVTDEQAIATGDALGMDIRTHKPITPTQAKAAGMPAAVVDTMTHTPRNGFKIVPDSTSTKAKRVFT